MPTILVVDDTAVDRRLAGGLLEKAPEMNVCYAENGQDALLKIGDFLPDLVVTDLQMPDLDGLQLVNSISERYPDVPVVLMTAHGSENIAAQALASGAASYVPKADLADSLVETVRHILHMTETDARYRRLISCATRTEFEFRLENDPELIPPLVDLVHQVLDSQQIFDVGTRLRVGVALEQALSNAMIRGNLEINREQIPYASRELIVERARQGEFQNRRVELSVLVTPEKAHFVVRDQGPGFDLSLVPAPHDPESFRDGIGRGLVLIRTFMDVADFSDHGRTLTMTKYRSESPNKPR